MGVVAAREVGDRQQPGAVRIGRQGVQFFGGLDGRLALLPGKPPQALPAQRLATCSGGKSPPRPAAPRTWDSESRRAGLALPG
ncbi:MAG: hypothetical protein MUF25_21470 [Pirellulaceae bacterium]|nr:hypothetical protein [Pirellulaceae bacterium]